MWRIYAHLEVGSGKMCVPICMFVGTDVRPLDSTTGRWLVDRRRFLRYSELLRGLECGVGNLYSVISCTCSSGEDLRSSDQSLMVVSWDEPRRLVPSDTAEELAEDTPTGSCGYTTLTSYLTSFPLKPVKAI